MATSPCQKEYKFIRRVLNIGSQDSDKVIIKSRLKGLYFKRIYSDDENKFKLPRLKKKCLNFLTSLQLYSTDPNCQEYVKTAKNLKHNKIEFMLLRDRSADETIQVLRYFSILPKGIQKIMFHFDDFMLNSLQLSQIYQKISCLKNLTVFQRDFDSLDQVLGEDFFKKEYELIHKYLGHLKKLNEFEYCVNPLNQVAVNQMMKDDKKWPYVTTLSLYISEEHFEEFYDVEDDLNEEESVIRNDLENKGKEDNNNNNNDGSEENKIQEEDQGFDDEMLINDNNDNGNNEEEEGDIDDDSDNDNGGDMHGDDDESMHRKILSLRNKFAMFFKFHLFQNLRKLEITISSGSLIPISFEVTEGFRFLKRLTELVIRFEMRPAGSKHILEGMIHLPLLTLFELETRFIREDDHVLLTEFFQKQIKLENLSLAICLERRTLRGYSEQNILIELIWQYLENKPHLQYLSIESNPWPIQSLSKGLAKAPTLDQLKSFSVKTFDDFMLSSEPATQQVEGFSDFIRRHKNSLRHITISLEPVIQNDIVTSLLSVFSELENLKDLKFFFEGPKSMRGLFDKIYPTTYFSVLKEKPKRFENIYSSLKRMLKALPKLSKCNVLISCIENEIDTDTLIKLLKVSCEIKTLEKLTLTFPTSEDTDARDLTYLRKAFSDLRTTPFFSVESANNIPLVNFTGELTKLNERRSLRCDVMF